jgi:hypothetical protein
MNAVDCLEPCICYFPISAKPFEFTAGLKALPKSPSDARQRVLQIDRNWSHYRAAKRQSRAECLRKYVCCQGGGEAAISATVLCLLQHLSGDYPSLFHLETGPQEARLECRLSGETLIFDQQLRLQATVNAADAPPYVDAIDALCCQIQEDIAVVELVGGVDAITYLHLCLPNHWAAAEKIGRSFVAAHGPVPAMRRISQQAPRLIATLAHKGPYERFTWGLATDSRLNHHPEPPSGWPSAAWQGRRFDPNAAELYLRIERQVTVPLVHTPAFLFTIRTYLRDVATLTGEECARLSFALQTMPAEVAVYKGLATDKAAILAWLGSRL